MKIHSKAGTHNDKNLLKTLANLWDDLCYINFDERLDV